MIGGFISDYEREFQKISQTSDGLPPPAATYFPRVKEGQCILICMFEGMSAV